MIEMISMNGGRPHWRDGLAETIARLEGFPRVLIASDFDGTLSRLVDQPAMAILVPGAPRAIADLAKLYPRVRLAFLSGRSLRDLAPRLGILPEEVVLAGNHGLEISGARMDWTHPVCVAARPHLAELAEMLRQTLGMIPGVELEDKGASLTLHYRRMASAELATLRTLVDALALPGQLRIHEGNKVFEFRPRVDWNKGNAIRRIMRRFGIPDEAVVYLGDDLTDEDVFRELDSRAVTLHVGSVSDRSSARLNAGDPADAVEFLEELTTMNGLAR